MFLFRKKQAAPAATSVPNKALSVKVLGSGCAKCNRLEETTRQALDCLGYSAAVEHIKDFSQIAAYGVMTTPALVVNEKVVASGRELSLKEAMQLIEQAVR